MGRLSVTASTDVAGRTGASMNPVGTIVIVKSDIQICRRLCQRGLLEEHPSDARFPYTFRSWNVRKGLGILLAQHDTRPIIAQEIA